MLSGVMFIGLPPGVAVGHQAGDGMVGLGQVFAAVCPAAQSAPVLVGSDGVLDRDPPGGVLVAIAENPTNLRLSCGYSGSRDRLADLHSASHGGVRGARRFIGEDL